MRSDSLQSILDMSDELPFCVLVISVKDAPGRILHANDAMVRLAGCASFEELLAFTGGDPRALILREGGRGLPADPSDRQSAEPSRGAVFLSHRSYQVLSKDGGRHDVVSSETCVDDAQCGSACVLFLSVLDDGADNLTVDPVSGLHTRQYLMRYYDCLCASRDTAGHEGTCSVCYLHISRFKDFNEAWGHEAGDALLRDLGALMTDVFQTESCARLYADQFCVLFRGDDVRERCAEAHERALRLRDEFAVHVEIGVYRVGDEPVAAAAAMDRAKVACDAIRGDGRRFYNEYSEELAEALRLDAYIVENVDRAIREGHVEVWYQPVIRTMTGDISGFEALARWRDPTYGMLSPGRFIPVLEARRLAYKIDCHVIDRTCAAISALRATGADVVPVSVNLSRADFGLIDSVAFLASCIAKYQIPPDLIAVEITETAAMQDPAVVADAIDRFREAGHAVLMDDFGSAYSSLNALRMFHFDEIKLDRAFMETFDQRARDLVESIVSMVKKLGMHTLAEGVETEVQAAFLRSIGCERIQGYYYGRPQSRESIADWAATSRRRFERRDERLLHGQAGLANIVPSKR